MAAAGWSETQATDLLVRALPPTVKDWENAAKTIAWGLARGRERPIELEDRPEYGQRDTGTHRRDAPNGESNKTNTPEGEANPSSEDDDYLPEPFTSASLMDLQPYDWVYKRFMVARYFCALGAPPGTGKSALIIIIALSI